MIFKVNIIDFLAKCSTLMTHLGMAQLGSLGSQDMPHTVNLSVTTGTAVSVSIQLMPPAGFKDHSNEAKQGLEEVHLPSRMSARTTTHLNTYRDASLMFRRLILGTLLESFKKANTFQ